jgi:hypothetical protein
MAYIHTPRPPIPPVSEALAAFQAACRAIGATYFVWFAQKAVAGCVSPRAGLRETIPCLAQLVQSLAGYIRHTEPCDGERTALRCLDQLVSAVQRFGHDQPNRRLDERWEAPAAPPGEMPSGDPCRAEQFWLLLYYDMEEATV